MDDKKKTEAFLTVERKTAPKKSVQERLKDYKEIYRDMADEELKWQAARCMDCGVPFCHNFGCPLGNNIPEWNEMVYFGRFKEAAELLQSTNNFPEITGRICPSLCEAACTMNINDDPMAIRQNELYIIEKAFENDWITPCPPTEETGKSVAVIGSGPAGLAAAQQLRRVGHRVVVYEKSDTFGGLLRYGIPEFKLEKNVIDRRIEQMKTEGVIFEGKVDVGVDISADFLIKRYDAVCICIGAGVPRDLPVPGRELDGIHFAMDYLTQQTQKLFGVKVGKDNEINAKGKNVVVIGGGDTGSDCLGTALRQGAKSVVQMEILPAPPEGENPDTPWPEYPRIYRTSSSHEEGGERRWSVCTTEFLGKDGRVTKLKGSEVKWSEPDENGRRNMEMVKGSEFELPCDLAVLAMGFTQPVHEGLLDGLGVEYDNRGNVKTDAEQRSSVKGVYAAGDANTGASLVVRCIAAGRRLAHTVDLDLMGESDLPTPD